MHQAREDLQIVRGVRDGVAIEAQQPRGRVDRVRDQPARHHAERVQPVGERGGDPEVAAAAAQRPEQVRVRFGRDLDDLAVGGHELDREHVVRCQAELRHEPAEPAAEREPGDPRRGDGPTRDRQPVLRGRGVELGPRHAPLGACRSGLGVDPDPLHLGQVDHHGVVRDREPGHVVTAAPDGDLVPATTGEAHRRGHVGRRPAAHDQRRSAIDQPVVDSPGVVVARIAGLQQPPGEGRGQRVNLWPLRASASCSS